MARARNIKPGLFKNEILGVADPLYTILFEGLWVLADRDGRLEDRPLRIKAETFPYREGLDMEAMLDWLATNGFIERYESKGVKVIHILEFAKHQNPHKNEVASELPSKESAIEEISTTPDLIGTTRADSLFIDSLNLITDPAPLALPAAPKKSKPASRKTPLPNDFELSERVRRWAAEKSHGNLEQHFDNFVSACRKSGYTYADWDEALMDAVRKNWARITPAAAPAKQEYL